MAYHRWIVVALAIGILSCDDVGEVGYGVSGVVRSASTHDPIPNAWATFNDTTAVDKADGGVDSAGNFTVGTFGCSERQLFVGAPGFITFDTTIATTKCRSISGLVIELMEAP